MHVMEIRVALLPVLAGDVQDAVCIVIDALRATSAIAVLFARNCPRVYVAAGHEAAIRFARENRLLLCGETGGRKPEGFDFGNSPVEFLTQDFQGRPVVLSTTNGTYALSQVRQARHVFAGAPLNRTAVAQAAWTAAQQAEADIVIVCSGTDGDFTLEDATSAGLFVEALIAQATPWELPLLDDAAVACKRLWQQDPQLLRSWLEGRHAQHLAEIGFGEDVAYCAQLDRLSVVPELVRDSSAELPTAPIFLVPA
ncbi:2-phosphosulfolactate phosphatase [Chthonomonas calidirosea]|uniref:Probable 2-phosphosulfolactate phosphatase n=1 Tax=Chthonomonas calidirosea (strain DSM 23976 / ICMP 18418 / T49) TaxID=1303518 RepID=S0F031_CHTCT|nr:2-phosphosulfolactate phosphatase [Chthonomonas calidirosea]CCW36412.1 2-phosphosulfolactate phosphatase [Chthonomonas calidirosea T49]CEK16333.1 2-phosphosulfolactate phosphatase [Chthonomonas calidirosea]CEK17413.1 2-phosphosulfolactate phosphatase [Chthonomonas calidirosea]